MIAIALFVQIYLFINIYLYYFFFINSHGNKKGLQGDRRKGLVSYSLIIIRNFIKAILSSIHQFNGTES